MDVRQFKETCSCGASIQVEGERIWADKLMAILAEWRADHHHHEADGSGDSRLGFAASELAT